MTSALIFFLAAVVFCWLAQRRIRLWLYADHYSPAELEVVRFFTKPRDSDARCQIEGVVHPGGQAVVASDDYIAIKQFDGPGDKHGREPTPAEIEGKRLPVSYWTRAAGTERWWHPPVVVTRGEIPAGDVVLRTGLIGASLAGLGVFCFRRGVRQVKATLPRSSVTSS